jgi:hypothetical protein
VDSPAVSDRERSNLTVMPFHDPNDTIYVDVNGCLVERVPGVGFDVIVHYDDIPESDVTIVDGIRCTTALRTVIDLATEYDRPQLEHVVGDCLERRLFTRAEALARIAEPDMERRPGAALLAQVLNRLNSS